MTPTQRSASINTIGGNINIIKSNSYTRSQTVAPSTNSNLIHQHHQTRPTHQAALRNDAELGDIEDQDDGDEDDEVDDIDTDYTNESDGSDDDYLPPLVPPFRFAVVESTRYQVARDISAQHSSSASLVSSGSSSAAGSSANLKHASSKSSLSNVSSTSSVTSLVRADSITTPMVSNATSSGGSVGGGVINLPATQGQVRERRGSANLIPSQLSASGALSSITPSAGVSVGAATKPIVTGAASPPASSPPTSPVKHQMLASMMMMMNQNVSTPASNTTHSYQSPHSTPDHSVYRGAYPTLKNFHFLSRLRLRTIISLIPESPTVDLKEFCQRGGRMTPPTSMPNATNSSLASLTETNPSVTPIKLYHFACPKWAENVAVTMKQVMPILQILTNADNLPAYVHCIDGLNNTSMIVACLRKLQCWSSVPVLAEFIRFTRDGCGVLDSERLFLERFNHTAVHANGKEAGSTKTTTGGNQTTNLLFRVPQSLPSWLWAGHHIATHPHGIRLLDTHAPSIHALHTKLITSDTLTPPSSKTSTPTSSTGGANSVPQWKTIDEDESLWDGKATDETSETEEQIRKKKKKEEKERLRLLAQSAASLDPSVSSSDLAPSLEQPSVDAESSGSLPPSSITATASAASSIDPSAIGDIGRSHRKSVSGSSLDGAGGSAGLTDELERATPAAARSRSSSLAGKSTNEDEKKIASASNASSSSPKPSSSVSSKAAPPPSSARASPPLSHPGEFHSLLDLDKSAWQHPISHIKADMLFIAGSWNQMESFKTADTPVLASLKITDCEEEQFVEMANDKEERFTIDDFDSSVSLLVSSLCLEGFTMNHKITRPMQIFHHDQGQT